MEDNKNLEPNRGTVILVLGILGLLVCVICSIFAWIWGNEDLRKIEAGTMDASNIDNIKVGRILGIVGCCLGIFGIIICITIVIIMAIVAVNSSPQMNVTLMSV